jgi:hypothetical protein
MSATNRITLVLRPNEGATLEDLQQYAKLGMPVGVGRALGVIAGAAEGDVMERAEQLENQVILAEAAMRRGVLLTDKECLPALRRVIDQVPELYREVADAIKQAALDDGADESTAEEAAGQAIRVLVMFKQRMEKLLDPDPLTPPAQANLITENPLVAETPYAQVRVTDIGEWIRTVTNAKRYEWLRDRSRVEDADTDLLAARGDQIYYGPALDRVVDDAMRLTHLVEKHGEPV